MSVYKKLFGQTVTYGVSTILGRFLNYLLVFLHQWVFQPEQYAVVTELYAYTTFLIVIYTYGMETAFFRFASRQEQTGRVYSTGFWSLAGSSLLLSGLLVLFSSRLAAALDYTGNSEYIWYFAGILALDAIAAIPFAYLRQHNRSVRFVSGKLLNIGVNILLNLYFLFLCPWIHAQNPESTWLFFYNPEIGVGYIFVANLAASVVTLLYLLPELGRLSFRFDPGLWKTMLAYGIPLMFAGLAGMVNEAFSRVSMRHLIPGADAETQLGIFGFWYRVTMIMTMFTQAFRFAAEPFFFQQAAEKDDRQVYARVMDYYLLACLVIFLGVVMHADLLLYFIREAYHPGIRIIPVLLLANLFLGIYINLSIWFKLSDRTNFGIWFTLTGAAITVGGNYLLVPAYGYTGAAWVTLVCYLVMTIACYFTGRRYFPIPYHLKKLSAYFFLALFLFACGAVLRWLQGGHATFFTQIVNSLLFLAFLLIVYLRELKLKAES